jgi:glutamyl-tRNA synthetase
VRQLVPLVQERLKRLSDVVGLTDLFFTEAMTHDPAMLVGKKMTQEASLAALEKAIATLEGLPDFGEETLETALRGLADALGLKARQLLGIIRAAVTGKKVSPPLFGTLYVLGRERSLARMRQAWQTGTKALAKK